MKFLKSIYRKKRKNESWVKYVSYLLHLWLGLLSAVVVMILCLTGCLYAFKNQVTDFTNREIAYVKNASGKQVSVSSVQKQFAKEGKELTSVVIPRNPQRSFVISYKEGNVDKTCYYDQYAKRILGVPNIGANRFFEIVLDLHRNLMMANFGRQVVGASVLTFCFLLLSGLILWLPKKLKYVKQGLTIKIKSKFARLNHDIHNVMGFYTFLLLFFIAVTGLYVTYPWMKNTLIVALGGASIAEATAIDNKEANSAFDDLMADMMQKQNEKKATPAKTVPLDQIINLSNKELSYNATTSVALPNKDNPRFVVIKTNTENMLGMMLPDEVTFDQAGQLKSKNIFAQLPLNKQFTALAKPLHTGEIMGLASIIIYFIVCLIGFLLPVTGFFIWWHRYAKMK